MGAEMCIRDSKDRRMREAGIAVRTRNYDEGLVSGAWLCGGCWIQELEDRGHHVADAGAATQKVRRTPEVTEPEDDFVDITPSDLSGHDLGA